MLSIVWDFCTRAGLSFRFLPTPAVHTAMNSKYAPRKSSGKLVTIYCSDDEQLESVLENLSEELAGLPGPYILSDLRWGRGPLYVRFGAFRRLPCADEKGAEVHAVMRPDGVLEPDPRGPVFRVPSWVEVPAFVAAEMTAARANSPELPYRVERALHYSNGGGIYLARDPDTDERVILREARPMAGLDMDGRDAVTRLHTEASLLAELSDLDFGPDVLSVFTVREHHFLAEEYFAGQTLWEFMARGNPLIKANPEVEAVRDYTEAALGILDQLASCLDRLHERGYVFGDLHPRNVIIRDDGRVGLVDFEIARRLGAAPLTGLGCPGYIAAHATRGTSRDDYALDSMRAALFLPLTQLIDLHDSKIEDLAQAVSELYPVPASHRERSTTGLARPRAASPAWPTAPELFAGELPSLQRSSATSILASATPGRTDRLHPGDPAGLTGGGYGISHGAAGVLYALHGAGYEIPDRHLRWLRSAALGADLVQPGLLDGLHGAALVLQRLGDREGALELVRKAAPAVRELGSTNLRGGLAGVAVALHELARHDPDPLLRQELDEVAELVDRPGARYRPGLFTGGAGKAFFHVRQHEATAEDRHLDAARQAIALAVRQYLTHRQDDELAAVLPGLRLAMSVTVTVLPSLYGGRAGLISTLARQPGNEDLVDQHIRRLAWHTVPYGGGFAFPGHWLLRLSMDLATGTAGVLAALNAVRDARDGAERGLVPGLF